MTDIKLGSVEQPKIEQLNVSNVATIPENNVKLNVNAVEPKEDTPETPKAGVTKHIVTFIGNGVWFDNKGVAWSKKTGNPDIKQSMEFTDKEFESRGDIKFMIEYGTMTDVVVSL